MYGLDAFVAQPPLSAILSILLIVGCDGLGLVVIRLLAIEIQGSKWLRWQALILGALCLSVVAYPLALMGYAGLLVFRVIALSLLAIAIAHVILIFYQFREGLFASSHNSFREAVSMRPDLRWLLAVILIVFGLYALSPVTNADSLDYHLGVAMRILATGNMPVTPEWFHSRLAGSGEVLNAIGLSIGAEQFGSLLQFIGLLGIFGLLYHAKTMHYGHDKDLCCNWRVIISLAAVSSPVLIFLVGSAKPQLLPVAMTTLAIAITACPSRRNLDNAHALKGFMLVCLLAMVASQAKFTYLLGGGVAGVIAFIAMYRRRLFFPAVAVFIACFVIVILPPVIWKFVNFGGGFLQSLLTPLPGGWPGTAKFEVMLRNYHDSKVWFPFSLLIPAGPGTITTIIGIGLSLPIFLRPRGNKWSLAVICGAFFVVILSVILGPPTSRSYLEPFFWLLLVLAFQSPPSIFIRYRRLLTVLIVAQASAVILIVLYGVVTSFPGVVSAAGRTKVMNRMADGYKLMRWVDHTLPKDAVLLNSHRSMALVPRKAVSLDWFNYTKTKYPSYLPYLKRIKDGGVTYLLLIGNNYTDSPYYKFFYSCLGDKVYGPGYGEKATRNPFNKGGEYKAWLLKFNSALLPGCVDDKRLAHSSHD